MIIKDYYLNLSTNCNLVNVSINFDKKVKNKIRLIESYWPQ